METTYLIVLWGCGVSEVVGPFGELDDAKCYLDDYAFADSSFDGGLVTSAPVYYSRIE